MKITLTSEAKQYIEKEKIRSIGVSVEIIPCGCARPRELPTVSVGEPKETEHYHQQIVGNLTVYLSKTMKTPNDTIEIKLEQFGKETRLYPTGMEYFIAGVGSYCKLSESAEIN